MKIINHILIDGRDLMLESLPPQERERIEQELATRMIMAAGGVVEERQDNPAAAGPRPPETRF